MLLSPAKAAEIAKCSRSLISKEVKSGNIIAEKSNRGHLKITRENLDDWLSRRTERAASPEPAKPTPAVTVTSHEDAARIAGLEVKVEMLGQQLEEMRVDRAKLLGMITEFSKPKLRWWQRIHRT